MRFALFCVVAVAIWVQCGALSGVGTKNSPVASCQELNDNGAFQSGVYWLKPPGVAQAFQGYCDLSTQGGGWLMCYTTNDEVHVSREVSSQEPYGTDGYRSDCRNYPFNHVMFVNHASNQQAWFQYNGYGSIVASGGGYTKALDASWAVTDEDFGYTWSGKGVASFRSKACRDAQNAVNTGGYSQASVVANCETNQYHQLLVCDNSPQDRTGHKPWYFGFMVTEKSDTCTMSCSDLCGDYSNEWYRASTGYSNLHGVAFKENGNQNVANKLISVGIRFGQELPDSARTFS